MKIISLHSHKGGTGKTTMALLIAQGQAIRGKRVCVVDLDFLGAGICDMVKLSSRPQRYIEEALMAAASCDTAPDLAEMTAVAGSEGRRIHLVLNAVGARSGTDELYCGIRSLLELERQAQVIERGLNRLLAAMAEAGYDYAILDCPPSLAGVSEAVFKVQSARPIRESAILLITTPDKADCQGLFREMERRSRWKHVSIRRSRTVLVANKVPRLDSIPDVEGAGWAKHYCRILWSEALARFGTIGSDGQIPAWPSDGVGHSQTKLCEELFGVTPP